MVQRRIDADKLEGLMVGETRPRLDIRPGNS